MHRPYIRSTSWRCPVAREFITHKGLFGLTETGQARVSKGDNHMAKKDPEKVIKDLKSYRVYGNGQRVLDDIESFKDVETVKDCPVTRKTATEGDTLVR